MKAWKEIIFSAGILATPASIAQSQEFVAQEPTSEEMHVEYFVDLKVVPRTAPPAGDDQQPQENEESAEEAPGSCELTLVCFEAASSFWTFSSQVIAVEESCGRYHYCPLRLHQTLEDGTQGPGCLLAYLGLSMEEFDALLLGQGTPPTEPALDREPFVIQESIDCVRGQVATIPEEETTSSSGEDYAMESSFSSSSSGYSTSSSYDAWYSSSSSSYGEYF